MAASRWPTVRNCRPADSGPLSRRPLRPAIAALALLLATGFEGEAAAGPPPRFPEASPWHQDISRTPLHTNSATMISTLAGLGGFGYGRMQIDFSFLIVNAPAGAPTRTIVGYPSSGSYYAPDCEPIGTAMPVPANAVIEGGSGLVCDNANNDCHLLVVQGDTLYEAYRANASGGSGLQAQCLAVWKLAFVYPDNNRGEHCTSADAAGFPIAPLLFNADEVYAATQRSDGDLGHAIRFILPNARMGTVSGQKAYVHPASHAGAPSGPEGSVPYGSRLRLRADFPVALYPPAHQVILRTMQRYGVVLADGGNIALTAEGDFYNTHKWAELGIDSRAFDLAVPSAVVRVQDFAVLDTGPRIIETYNCQRNPPILAVDDAAIAEGQSGSKPLNFMVHMSAAAPGAVSFDYYTDNGTAAAGSDYQASAALSASIAAGQVGASIPVNVLGDSLPEANESFVLNLVNPVGASIGDAQARGRIDNDDLPALSVGDATVAEGNSGTVTASFALRLSAPSPTPVSFDIGTGNGSASAGSDYLARNQARTIDPGRTNAVFEVAVNGDVAVEGDETFTVSLANVMGATLADGSGLGTIGNDDGSARIHAVAKAKAGVAGPARPR